MVEGTSRLPGVAAYYGWLEEGTGPMRRREGPSIYVLLMVSFGGEWIIDGQAVESFAAGLYERQVTTEHAGRSHGMQVDLAPPAARVLLGEPLHELAGRCVPLEDFLGPSFVERLYDAGRWRERFTLLDELLATRLADASPPSCEVAWAWRRLVDTGGRVRIGALAAELGWSRKRIAARFCDEIGLTPKAAARVIRFAAARARAEHDSKPDWARIALDCGYYDQSHLINDFRAVTGRTPETFFQDARTAAA